MRGVGSVEIGVHRRHKGGLGVLCEGLGSWGFSVQGLGFRGCEEFRVWGVGFSVVCMAWDRGG